ncbi:MAG: ribonuclease HI family protein [Candidatus Korobacteraceae bacterium]|jgi:ribonuclease HI
MPFRSFPKKKTAGSEDLVASSSESSADSIVAYIDGGSRGNPGPSGYGVAINDAAGRRIAELSDYLGVQTNNFAEYSGLLAALEYAVKHGHKALKVVSDSELLVKQMRGEYKVRNETLQQMAQEARGLIRKLESFQIRHVLRAQNREADGLANQAMDSGTGRKTVAQTATAQPAAEAPREVNGRVVNGRVEFLDGSLPEGTRVKVRPVRKR